MSDSNERRQNEQRRKKRRNNKKERKTRIELRDSSLSKTAKELKKRSVEKGMSVYKEKKKKKKEQSAGKGFIFQRKREN